MKLMERNYDYLKGTEVSYHGTNCFVAGCNPKKGISIVDIDDPDREVLCLNYDSWVEFGGKMNYKGAFACLVAKIKKNFIPAYLASKVYVRDKSFSPVGSGHPCGFK